MSEEPSPSELKQIINALEGIDTELNRLNDTLESFLTDGHGDYVDLEYLVKAITRAIYSIQP